MTKKRNTGQYFRILQSEDSQGVPELLMYGYIGQKADEWWGEDPEEDITDLAVVRIIRDLEKRHRRINIRINSPGGSVMHGDPIITAIRNSNAEIHTYVDGMAASMAFDIWLSGHKRHVGINSKLMIHATSTVEWGTAKHLRQAADMLDKFDAAAIATFAAVTDMEESEIRERFYDYEDHWITAKEAVEIGLSDEIDSYQAVQVIEEPEKMTFRQLLTSATRMAIPEPKEKEPESESETEIEKHTDTWRAEYVERLEYISKLN